MGRQERKEEFSSNSNSNSNSKINTLDGYLTEVRYQTVRQCRSHNEPPTKQQKPMPLSPIIVANLNVSLGNPRHVLLNILLTQDPLRQKSLGTSNKLVIYELFLFFL